eukprot:1790188-Amphidinium_carterae.1
MATGRPYPARVFPYPSGEKDRLLDACKNAVGGYMDGEQVDVDEGDLDWTSLPRVLASGATKSRMGSRPKSLTTPTVVH